MSAIGGPIQDVSIDGRLFAVAADADVNLDLGGYTTEFESNGDGGARDVMARRPWKVEGIDLVVDHDRGDLEFLQEKADEPGGRFPITITLVNNVTYQGTGKPAGEMKTSTKNATVSVMLSGPGKLEQQ
jgi:hypothetical protein